MRDRPESHLWVHEQSFPSPVVSLHSAGDLHGLVLEKSLAHVHLWTHATKSGSGRRLGFGGLDQICHPQPGEMSGKYTLALLSPTYSIQRTDFRACCWCQYCMGCNTVFYVVHQGWGSRSLWLLLLAKLETLYLKKESRALFQSLSLICFQSPLFRLQYLYIGGIVSQTVSNGPSTGIWNWKKINFSSFFILFVNQEKRSS